MNLYKPSETQVFEVEDPEVVSSSNSVVKKPAYDLILKDNENAKLKGLSEYGWGLWLRQSRTGPEVFVPN